MLHASTMAAAPVTVTAESLNYYRYTRLVMVVPARYMARIFTWLHDGGSLSIDEFVGTNSGLLKKFNKTEKKKILERTDPAKMDITLLYKLLFHAGNIPSDNPPWHSQVEMGQQPSLGQVLYQLKGVRNENAHKDPEEQTKVTDDDLDTLAMTQMSLLTHMLTLAGQLAGKSQDTIAEAVTSMEADVATERHNEGGINLERFMSLAKKRLSLSKHRHAVQGDEYPDEDEQYGDLYEDEENEYEKYLYEDDMKMMMKKMKIKTNKNMNTKTNKKMKMKMKMSMKNIQTK